MSPEQIALLLSAGGAGAVVQHLTALITDRYQGRLAEQQRRADELESLRRAAHEWREATWVHRHKLVELGVLPDDLPSLPDKES